MLLRPTYRLVYMLLTCFVFAPLVIRAVRGRQVRRPRHVQDAGRRRVLCLRRGLDVRPGERDGRMPRYAIIASNRLESPRLRFICFVCADIDECDLAQGLQSRCGEGAICTNTPGGFSCECPQGFAGDPAVRCLGNRLLLCACGSYLLR